MWSKLLGSDSIVNPDDLKAKLYPIFGKPNTKPNFVHQGQKIHYFLTNTAPQSPRIGTDLT